MLRRTPILLLALAGALPLAAAACSSSSGGGAAGDDSGFDDASFEAGDDATTGGPEGGGDATTDTNTGPSPESGTDSSPPGDASLDSTSKDGSSAADSAPEVSAVDTGSADVVTSEAGAADGGVPEAAPEASTADSGTPTEAGPADAGTVDASSPEAGADAATEAATPIDAAGPDATLFVPPTCDGVVSPGEYGSMVDGQNQQSTGAGATWYMTWGDTALYVAIVGANTGEASVVYLSDDPAVAGDAGTAAAQGTTTGFVYDGTGASSLPMHAQLVAYVKDSYNETRAADGAGGWGAASGNALTVCTNGGTATREFCIPWTAVTQGVRPASFGWLGYVTSSSGFGYAQLPSGNPVGSFGTSAVFPWLYLVSDATPVTGTFPFASAVQR